MEERTAFRTCPFCEATCGLEVTVRGDAVVKVRGDAEDVFSHGFLCPKGVALRDLHEDPDRLRTPLVRRADGELAPASWDEALGVVAERLVPLLEAHGRDAVAVYIGNPAAHGLAALLYGRALLKTLGSKSIYSASTVDQRPKEISSALMFGTGLTVPIPDVDRTRYLLMLGANPLASNGSLLTAPDMRGRLRALRARGGKLVVVDPRRSRTAEEADEHHPIRPGTDALLLFALVQVLFAEDLVRPPALADGVAEVEALAQPFTPEAVAPATRIAADEIRRMARELAAADAAAVYGRIGTTTQEFGTLASWLVDVLNVLTGNLDRPGGAMFPLAAAGQRNASGAPGSGRPTQLGRWRTRVRGLPESLGELPVAALAEEMDTPGDGQVRALITLAGNPARSTPNSTRMERALAGLELYVALDLYVNESTRHADVILPAPSPLQREHYDLALYQLAIRNVANYSPPVLPLEPGQPDEWETLLRLAGIAAGQGVLADVGPLDDLVAGELARRDGADTAALLAAVAPRTGPARLLDILLRMGPYELTLADLEAAPHGLDLGALAPRLPDVLRTPSGRIELAPAPIVADVPRLRETLAREHEAGALVLVGRRQLRSNNSWMHNLPLLAGGPERCTLHVHPDDAARLGLGDGEAAEVRSRTGTIRAPVEVTDRVMAGVVSLPHGWGHDAPGARLGVAAERPGVNANTLADEALVDAISGNAVLNGIPVAVAAVREPLPA
ncbi:MAG TPA: molybdopterin oxidoreductase family protein [Solirubrobacteraceae bacterium]|nr:molybdopterin oxidoreductase family protein [Solirubrobacteraceae bacterium]